MTSIQQWTLTSILMLGLGSACGNNSNNSNNLPLDSSADQTQDTGTDQAQDTSADQQLDSQDESVDTPPDETPQPCEINQRVENNACASCPAGTVNDAGDDPSGGDTMCEPILCEENEFVQNNTCTSCPVGTGNEAGDDSSGEDTQCEELDECALALGVSCADFEQEYIKASNTDSSDRFGQSIALDGDTMVIGAPSESSNATGINGDQADNTAPESGAVYVFLRNNGVWTQQAYIKASNTDANDKFGGQVAIDGDTIVVSALAESSRTTGINPTGVNGDQTDNTASRSGAVYVFERSNNVWTQQAYIKASNTEEFDLFGRSIALQGDTLVVGAVNEKSSAKGVNGDQTDNTAPRSGAVYVFERNNNVWTQQAYIKASNTNSFDVFGSSVTLDGDTLAVGAPGRADDDPNLDQRSGAVYLFVRVNNMWIQQAYLQPAQISGITASFGWSVALSQDTLAIGASGESSNTTGIDGDPTNDTSNSSGAAYIFVRINGVWIQQAYIKSSNSENADYFGWSVALDQDTLVVSAPEEDSNALGINGDQSDNTSRDSGAVYVFKRNNDAWTQQAYVKSSATGAFDNFGNQLALHNGFLIISAPLEASNATGIDGDQTDNTAPSSGAVYMRQIQR